MGTVLTITLSEKEIDAIDFVVDRWNKSNPHLVPMTLTTFAEIALSKFKIQLQRDTTVKLESLFQRN